MSGQEIGLHVVRSIREQRRSVTVLLAGTSGTGKSTLAGLLAARLGISTVPVHRLRAPHAAQLHPAGRQPAALGLHLPR